MQPYGEFLRAKAQEGAQHGFEPISIPDALYDFQRELVEWAIRKGRAAIFADCGLGKTLMQLSWADNVQRHTGRPVLILTPLAVGTQTAREAERFGIPAARSRNGELPAPIVITNYERLHHYDPAAFSGVVLDESSILKSFDGARRNQITAFMRKIPYRLLATATAAPNDYVELGTSSEALGYLGHMDMLARFFKNDQNNSATRRMYGQAPTWRFKGHAERPFWRWVSSWARALRKPSDLGYENGAFELPALVEHENVIQVERPPEEMLFAIPATTLAEQRKERTRTLPERVQAVAHALDHDRPAIAWCHTNAESKALCSAIPGAVEVAGAHSDHEKEERLTAFLNGEARVLVTKPSIGGWGLNFQHCADMAYFPSHSYEAYYQAVRRCWRYGQTKQVNVHLVMGEGETRIMANLRRKAEQADSMFENLVREMRNELAVGRRPNFITHEEVPAWLSPNK